DGALLTCGARELRRRSQQSVGRNFERSLITWATSFALNSDKARLVADERFRPSSNFSRFRISSCASATPRKITSTSCSDVSSVMPLPLQFSATTPCHVPQTNRLGGVRQSGFRQHLSCRQSTRHRQASNICVAY